MVQLILIAYLKRKRLDFQSFLKEEDIMCSERWIEVDNKELKKEKGRERKEDTVRTQRFM